MSEKTRMQNISPSRHFLSFHHSFVAFSALAGLVFAIIFVACKKSSSTESSPPAEVWVGTWSTAPQLVEPGNIPPKPGLSDNTLRQIVRVSIGGDRLRVRFSNEFSTSPVTMKAVHLAASVEGSEIDPDTDQALLFDGEPEATMEPGAAITSDPFEFALEPRTNVAITIHFGDTSPDVTGHPGSRTTSYLLEGNKASAEDFIGAKQTDHWYVI